MAAPLKVAYDRAEDSFDQASSIVVILFEPRGVWGACRRWGVPDLLPVSYGPLAREPQNGSPPSEEYKDKLPIVGPRPERSARR